MTTTTPKAALPMTGLGRPFRFATDLTKRAFQDEDMALYDLFIQQVRAGRPMIEGITFTGCRIEGPAVMLVLPGTTFDATNFGDSHGDIGNLVLRPVRSRVIGTIPVINCTFVGCEFHGLGFTGERAILDEILAIPSA